MKYLLIIIIAFIVFHISAKNILIVDFGGKRKVVNSHQYSETGKITTYTIEGTFTDHLANYGAWNSMVNTQIEDGKIVTLDFSTMWNIKIQIEFILDGDEEIVMRTLV